MGREDSCPRSLLWQGEDPREGERSIQKQPSWSGSPLTPPTAISHSLPWAFHPGPPTVSVKALAYGSWCSGLGFCCQRWAGVRAPKSSLTWLLSPSPGVLAGEGYYPYVWFCVVRTGTKLWRIALWGTGDGNVEEGRG